MTTQPRYAVLLDGGFVIKKLQTAKNRFPIADDVERVACGISARLENLSPIALLRTYFYHARPASAELTHPLNKQTVRLAGTRVSRDHESLIDALELKPNFAVRLGETSVQDWRIGSKAMTTLLATQRAIEPNDLVPNIAQKGVDLRIGLDLARLALRDMVDTVVVVTGDSDLIPAFRFVRREGVRVVLATLGHGVKRDLKAHADLVWEETIS